MQKITLYMLVFLPPTLGRPENPDPEPVYRKSEHMGFFVFKLSGVGCSDQ